MGKLAVGEMVAVGVMLRVAKTTAVGITVSVAETSGVDVRMEVAVMLGVRLVIVGDTEKTVGVTVDFEVGVTLISEVAARPGVAVAVWAGLVADDAAVGMLVTWGVAVTTSAAIAKPKSTQLLNNSNATRAMLVTKVK